MKKIYILLCLSFNTFYAETSSSIDVALLSAAASIAGASPLLWRSFSRCVVQRYYLDDLLAITEDADQLLCSYIRKRLTDQGYPLAEKLPIKRDDGHFSMETRLDACLCISKEYEEKIKTILLKDESFRDATDAMILGDFIITLDHEMLHIQNSHAYHLRTMQLVIPCVTELLTLPLLYKLSETRLSIFIMGLLASIPLKWFINEELENSYRRYQEQAADEWAISKNSNIDHLNALINFRNYIVYDGCQKLYLEHKEHGSSGSMVFDMLIKLFNHTDLDSDAFYEKLNMQPAQWPLRLLSYVFHPEHPFVFDGVQMAQKRI
ncbi:MAG: M48 family metalloprotease, partial [Candidatus Babeliales bacterium]